MLNIYLRLQNIPLIKWMKSSTINFKAMLQIFLNLYRSTEVHTVKPVLEITCIKKPPDLRDYCSDTITLLKST